MSEKMDVQFGGYCQPGQKQQWEKAAKAARRSLSDWMRITLDEAAERVIAEAAAQSKKPEK